MEKKTWTVVSFEMEGTVAVIPTTWIIQTTSGITECVWPPFTSAKTTQAIKNHDPINTCWPSFRIRVFRNATYDDYALAREKCRKAEETSDIAATDEEKKSSRNRRARRILSSSSDEDNNCNFISTPPRPEKNLRLLKTKKGQIDELPLSEMAHTSSVSQLSREAGISNTPPHTPVLGKNSCNQCAKNSDYIKEVLRQQYLIKNMVADLAIEINNIKKPISKQYIDQEDSLFKRLSLPCTNIEELTRLEEYLQDEENFKNAVIEISQIGGKHAYDFIRRVMCKIVTNGLATQYSWLGRREKCTFYTLKVAKLIIDAALLLEKGDQKTIESNISSWLRRAGERIKTLRKRGIDVD